MRAHVDVLPADLVEEVVDGDVGGDRGTYGHRRDQAAGEVGGPAERVPARKRRSEHDVATMRRAGDAAAPMRR